jgi:hypothetical protein
MTTGELQQRVYLHGERLPGRAVVVGAEHVSFSALVTLAHADADVLALVTDQPRHQSLAAFRLAAQVRWHVPVWTRTAVTGIIGSARMEAVELRDLQSGATRTLPCDTVVFTGDWIPDHVLARTACLAMDNGTLGPAIGTAMATSAPGVFAAGNLVHAAETADVAALSGRHAARQIALYLAAPGRAVPSPVHVVAEPPLRWISPNAIDPGVLPPLGRFAIRAAEFRQRTRLEAWQDGRLLARSRSLRLIPGRPVHLRAAWVTRVNPAGGPVRVGAPLAALNLLPIQADGRRKKPTGAAAGPLVPARA